MVDRKPVFRAKTHPIEDIVGSAIATHPSSALPEGKAAPTPPVVVRPGSRDNMVVTDQLNVRVRRSVLRRLEQATLTLSAQRGQRVSKASIVEEALADFFEQKGIR